MWSKWIRKTAALVLILALILALPCLAAGEGGVQLSLRSTSSRHEAYLHGYDDGSFRPNGFITRAEEAQMLYNLLETKPADRAALTDVQKSDWYYDALGLLAAAGVIVPDASGCVQPNAQLTRAQFIIMLVNLFPDLPEGECNYTDLSESAPWYGAIAKATAAGWVNGYEDGSFHASERVTRAEAAAIINRALRRSADRDKVESELMIPLYSDLTSAHWAYYEILEASIGHKADRSMGSELWVETDAPRYAPGPISVGTELYYADEEGVVVRDRTVGQLTFGADGRYTSGDAEADAYVQGILAEITTADMTREEKLLAAFDYVVESYSYLRRSDAYDPGTTGWEVEEALTILRTGRGNCYCYAGIMCLIARQIGYDAKAISGTTNWTPRPHAWVEIEFDGVPYIFDPEMEMASKGKYGDHHFYMLSYDIEATLWPYEK
jgi:hypothetical protein